MSSRRRIARVAPGTAYTAGNNFQFDNFDQNGTNQIVRVARPCLLEVEMAFSADGILYKRVNSVNLEVREGVPLIADKLYSFLLMADPMDDINFRYSVNTTIRQFYVHQVDGDVA
jgi:hypothetical protein